MDAFIGQLRSAPSSLAAQMGQQGVGYVPRAPDSRLRASRLGHGTLSLKVQRSAFALSASALLLLHHAPAAFAASSKLPPPSADPERCTLQALDNFAETRAKFSQEASSGAMVEALVDARLCDFSSQDLTRKVLSGVLMQGANFSNSNLSGIQMARADATGANMENVDFTDANLYSSTFNGANLQNAQFENSILTGSSFGKDASGQWANLQGAHFEGALVSSSDVVRICENPTLELPTKRFELGCRATK